MARLSEKAGDYIKTGMIVDKQQLVAIGGESRLSLSFIDGSEEVYKNGYRQMKGADQDYTADEANSNITFNQLLEAGDKVLLIGRCNANDIPFNKAVGETVVLGDGQTDVIFTSIETNGIEIYVSGPLVDRGRLISPMDFEIAENSNTIIVLKDTYPAGTIIEGVQGGRLAWVDADNLVVNDGTSSKSLSTRFGETQASKDFFIETNGSQLQDLSVGLYLQRWVVDKDTGLPVIRTTGKYPILKVGNSYWDPQTIESTYIYQVISWVSTDNLLTITAANTSTGLTTILKYNRRVAVTHFVDGNTLHITF